MNHEELRAVQTPLKAQYREQPTAAQVTLSATGEVALDDLTCSVPTDVGLITAGLHPAAGGDGRAACSGDMLLQALVACSGVTLAAVATSMSVELKSASVRADADMDFRGTLAVDREAPVGFSAVRLCFKLESSADDKTLSKLVELTERYCVVFRTLAEPAKFEAHWER